MSKYFSLIRLSLIHNFKEGKALIGLVIFLLTCLLIFANLWKVMQAKIAVINLNQNELLWYIALNEWVLVSIPDVQETIEDDLRTGRLSYLLPRPISYLGAVFCEAFGSLLVNLLILGFATFLFTFFFTSAFPFSSFQLIGTLFAGLLAGIVATLFQIGVGLSAFWLHSTEPFYWLWEKLLFTFGGLFLPLVLYPQWLQKIASFTPFKAILWERSALAFHFDISSFFCLLTSLFLWGIFALIIIYFLFRRGSTILAIGGG